MVLLLALVGAAVLAVPGAALATTGHSPAGQFGGAGGGDGQFLNGLWGAAVMPSTGEVFTLSGESGLVQRFDAAGAFQSSFAADPTYNPVGAIAADPAGFGSVYALAWGGAAGSAVLKYSAAGTFAYQLDTSSSGTSFNFFENAGLAVDPVDGTVYVAATDSFGAQVIARFDGSTGAFIDSFDGSSGALDGLGFSCPNGLAVDGSHRVYVLDTCKNRVDRYSATGTFEATIDDGSHGAPSAVAANPVSDEVYVSRPGPRGAQVAHLTAGGVAPVYTFDATGAGDARAMSVSGTGTVYIADGTDSFVKRFTMFDGPTVETLPPSLVEARSATLEGTIDPEGVESRYRFEYGTDKTYGSSTEESDPESGTDASPASAAITSLKPNTTYHYRIVGSNASGSIAGADQTFTTAAAPATVDGVPPFATAINPRSARIHGSVNPNSAGLSNSSGFATTYSFEYGTSTAYGATAVGGDGGTLCVFFFGCGGDDVPVAASLPGLEPGTTYHFRVVADNGTDGLQFGVDQTFITAPAAGGGASGVSTKRAALTGTINPHGQDTTYHFNYGPTSAYGASTPEVDGGAGDGDQLVSHQVSGLLPDTVYHVQVVAESDGGTRYGADGLFKTAPAPSAVAISPIGVSTGSATLVGDVETYGLPGSYRFDVSSLDSSYSTSTAEQPLAGNATVERISVPIEGLPTGETFVVRLVVTSNDSTVRSDQVTFATASLPPRVFPGPPSGEGASAYGCAAPRLDSYDAKSKPGDTITISGQDLGTGGTAVLGDRSLVPADWSATGFKLEIPEDATGTLGLTVNCGQRSNTVAIAILKKPSNRFSIASKAVRGSAATLSVKVPGPGKLTVSAANTKAVKTVAKKAGRATARVKLSAGGIKALERSSSGRLRVTVRVRFTPAGGKPATKKLRITFKHKAGG